MSNPYSMTIAPFVFPGSTFLVAWPDTVVKMRIEELITLRGGTLVTREPQYLVGERGMTPVQFWIGAGEYDRLQNWERMEEALIFLSSETPFPAPELEKIFWYIRENRNDIIEKIFHDNLTAKLC